MLTPKQEEWIAHLSDTSTITIKPFDPTAESKFQKIKQRILEKIDSSLTVLHRGASSLGISGQDEIDIYVPASPDCFNDLLESLKIIFGEPRSLYPLERARFITVLEDKHIDIFLINQDSNGWRDGLKFEAYLREHPSTLDQYKKLKESGHGLTVREYYRRKIEFINEILACN
jgi:GrpB-like predicted nucleotidyltransferase (UPF0157 family)